MVDKRCAWCVLGILSCLAIAACVALRAPAPPICQRESARVTAWASAEHVTVGEPFTVTVRVENTDCLMLGLPQYRLTRVDVGAEPIVDPTTIVPLVHYCGVSAGAGDEAAFSVVATRQGEIALRPSVSYELHRRDSAAWGSAAGAPVRVTVE